ncbi:MAG TPA: uracil-DNA glycosylase family protein [Tepidisphaeraceae bacterium]|nr:uracil-DNA glycosylase family protein [Tepidisphaeraceae bacterium]
MNTCKPRLLTELEIVKPKVLVCLGAIASKSLFGSQFKITTERGHIFKSDHAPFSLATWHPSALLRAPDEVTQKRMRREFTADITKAWRKI